MVRIGVPVFFYNLGLAHSHNRGRKLNSWANTQLFSASSTTVVAKTASVFAKFRVEIVLYFKNIRLNLLVPKINDVTANLKMY